MSTFKGVIDEFPGIRVDYFRPRPGISPPLAGFLSHIHSDHLEGLESYKSPFIYCSPATKELLVLLERKIHRVAFANGTSEGARNRRYKDLAKILRPIPLETPTKIELVPGNEVQVTLFDANHCVGAVMFLFEGHGKAVLYTGDIRSEPWWINNLTRNPFMIEYASGLKILDCIYLDTSNTERTGFPTKAEGLKELLQKVSKYPKDTVFHFASWTFGYEEVWMTLSKALGTPIHVDSYKYRLYESLCGNKIQPGKDKPEQSKCTQSVPDQTNKELSTNDRATEAELPNVKSTQGNSDKYSIPAMASDGPVLIGYKCGNTFIPGSLTKDQTVRLHSCEKGMCQSIENNSNTVWIRPIVTRNRDGAELAEIGIGGGGEDLTGNLEVELGDRMHVEETLKILEATEDSDMVEVGRILAASWRSGSKRLFLNGTGLELEEGLLTISNIVKALLQSVRERRFASNIESVSSQGSPHDLPKVITFPYSRHSSYDELCDLVRAFQPRDVYPCTVDEQYWDDGNISIRSLFGRLCSSRSFRHEQEMEKWRESRVERHASQQTHTTTDSQPSSQLAFPNSPEQARSILSGVSPRNLTRRNSLGQLKLLDMENNDISPRPRRGSSLPDQITAVSPNSESQGLRRKAIQDELESGGMKRVRFSHDLPPSSPAANTNAISQLTHDGGVDEVAPESGLENNRLLDDEPSRQVPEGTAYFRDISLIQSSVDYSDVHPVARDDYADFMDRVDLVWRCGVCGHELWGGDQGFCSGGCGSYPADRTSYYEVLDPEAPPLPEVALNEDTDEFLDGHQVKSVVGECMDYDSSAYDSQDSALDFSEDYDREDSFIDDPTDDEGSDSSTDDEPDYEAMYIQLRAQHNELIDEYGVLLHTLRVLRRAAGHNSSDSDHDDDDDDEDMDEMEDEMDDDGLLVVDVRAPEPVTTDIVISHAREQSQDSEVTSEIIRARAVAFDAAQELSWHNISLESTSDNNHTWPEIEL